MTLVAPDVSEYQHPLDDSYGRDLIIFRATFGAGYLDRNFLANANAAAKLYNEGRIAGAIVYTVPLASASAQAQFDFFWRAIGPKVPDWLMAVMLDAEAWRGTGYAMSGDHSPMLNTLYGLHAHRMGSWASCIGYGNRSDLTGLWGGRDPRCKVIVAAYGPQLVYRQVRGAIGQQYTDGQTKWGVPKGLPYITKPFGACDHNAFPDYTDGAALRAALRPASAVKPPTVKPKPSPSPQPFYAPGTSVARAFVSADRQWAAGLTNDGRIAINHRGTTARVI